MSDDKKKREGVAFIHLLRKGPDGGWLPGGYSMTVTRVPTVGEFLCYPDGRDGEGIVREERGPYRVTKVIHLPIGVRPGCDAEVVCELDDSGANP